MLREGCGLYNVWVSIYWACSSTDRILYMSAGGNRGTSLVSQKSLLLLLLLRAGAIQVLSVLWEQEAYHLSPPSVLDFLPSLPRWVRGPPQTFRPIPEVEQVSHESNMKPRKQKRFLRPTGCS